MSDFGQVLTPNRRGRMGHLATGYPGELSTFLKPLARQRQLTDLVRLGPFHENPLQWTKELLEFFPGTRREERTENTRIIETKEKLRSILSLYEQKSPQVLADFLYRAVAHQEDSPTSPPAVSNQGVEEL